MFNAIKYTQELEKAGFTKDQADVSVKLVIDVMNENFATKSDLKELKYELIEAMNERFSTKADLDNYKADLDNYAAKSDLKELEYRIIFRLSAIMGTMLTIAIAVTTTLIKIIPNN